MDPQQPSLQNNGQSLSSPHSHDINNNPTLSTFGSETSGNTTAATSTRTEPYTNTADISINTPSSSSSSSTLLGSIIASAKNVATTLDPRQADMLRQHHSYGNAGSTSAYSTSQRDSGGSSTKATASSASRTFQHTANALETLGSSSQSNAIGSGAGYTSGFRQTLPASSSTDNVGAMDWDSFLGSPKSTLQEDSPYKPPSMSSFGFTSLSGPETASPMPHLDSFQTSEQHRHQLAETPQQYQTLLSQSTNLTPANHAAFLEYLRSTANSSVSVAESSYPSSAVPVSVPLPQHQSFQYQQTNLSMPPTSQPLFSSDIQHQQRLDGSEVMAFLDSTSYTAFVDEIEAVGIEKHQQERREFLYSEAGLGPGTRSLFSTLQLIQHLPSERQDIVQYLLQQGTYAEDVWSRPFGHDMQREEAASLAATQAEQDLFLKEQYQRQGTDATTEEMERVLKQIIENATTEVKTGQTDGRALNRLLTVRSHITMGTKL